ncbi:MAG TPA: M14 family zinc carboxypeptidase [Burkholderiales bacterium]|nr:M14 family zinc carboxypeptidase [Burkholderiales bacterium]
MYFKLLFLLIISYTLHIFTGAAFAVPPALAEAPSERVLQTWCNEVTLAIPQIKLKPCVATQLKPVTAKSVRGREIMLREFKAEQTPAARVLVIGAMHGDELTSASIVFRWLELLQQRDSDAGLYHWQVIPVLNLDGLLAKPPTRVNAHGVDLNRNFPTYNWLKDAPHYWEIKTRRDPRRFPGTAPLSEPESRWLHGEIVRFRPDVIVSIHAPYGILDFDGPPAGIEAPVRFGRLHLNRVGVYPGSLGNFGGLKEGIPVVTLELPHALKMPTETELAHVWQDMLRWLKVNLVERKAAPVSPTLPESAKTPSDESIPAITISAPIL